MYILVKIYEYVPSSLFPGPLVAKLNVPQIEATTLKQQTINCNDKFRKRCISQRPDDWLCLFKPSVKLTIEIILGQAIRYR